MAGQLDQQLGTGQVLTRLDYYLLGRLIILFLFFTLVLAGVFWINIVVRLLEHVLPSFDDLFPLLTYFALYLPNAVITIMPLSAFASATYLTYRIIANNELTAIQATTGFSTLRFLRPYMLHALILMIISSLFTHIFTPASRYVTDEFDHRVIDVFNLSNIRTGEYLFPVEGVAIFIEDIEVETGEGEAETVIGTEYFSNVFIHDSRKEEYSYSIFASKTYLLEIGEQFLAVLIDGHTEKLEHATRVLSKLNFDKSIFRISLSSSTDIPRDSTLDQISSLQLIDPDAFDPPLTENELKRARFVLNERLNDSMVVAMIVLFGAVAVYNIGMIARGRNLSVLFAILVVVICYILGEYGVSYVERQTGLWIFNYTTTAALAVATVGSLILPARLLQRFGYLESR